MSYVPCSFGFCLQSEVTTDDLALVNTVSETPAWEKILYFLLPYLISSSSVALMRRTTVLRTLTTALTLVGCNERAVLALFLLLSPIVLIAVLALFVYHLYNRVKQLEARLEMIVAVNQQDIQPGNDVPQTPIVCVPVQDAVSTADFHDCTE